VANRLLGCFFILFTQILQLCLDTQAFKSCPKTSTTAFSLFTHIQTYPQALNRDIERIWAVFWLVKDLRNVYNCEIAEISIISILKLLRKAKKKKEKKKKKSDIKE